ncbi:MAG: hypothetical protein Q9M20_05750 [Mariprofundaceae bacterium]|nr:hypothetical protein [Mariprofundaceae bacterium]
MCEVSVGGVLFASLWGISLILCYVLHRKQKNAQWTLENTVEQLEEEIVAQKDLIQMQMQDLTTQMTNHAALHEKLHQAEMELLDLQRNHGTP